MSTDDSILPAVRVTEYDAGRAGWLAGRYASGEPGTGLSELARQYPDSVPLPMVVRRWRVVWPAFDALMVEAERDRADSLMEATLAIADDRDRDAAGAKNSLAARWRMAEALSPDRYAPRGKGERDGLHVSVTLTDSQLERLARGDEAGLALAGAPTAPRLVRGDGGEAGSEADPLSQSFDPVNAAVPIAASPKNFFESGEFLAEVVEGGPGSESDLPGSDW